MDEMTKFYCDNLDRNCTIDVEAENVEGMIKGFLDNLVKLSTPFASTNFRQMSAQTSDNLNFVTLELKDILRESNETNFVQTIKMEFNASRLFLAIGQIAEIKIVNDNGNSIWNLANPLECRYFVNDKMVSLKDFAETEKIFNLNFENMSENDCHIAMLLFAREINCANNTSKICINLDEKICRIKKTTVFSDEVLYNRRRFSIKEGKRNGADTRIIKID